MNFSRTHPIAVRPTESGHSIQSRTANVGLSDLGVKAARLELSAEPGLESEPSRLGQTALMIATLLFPLRQANLADALQNRRTRMHGAVRIRLPGLGILPRRNGRSCLSLRDRLMAVAAVIAAVGRDLVNRFGDLSQQLRQHFAIAHDIGRG